MTTGEFLSSATKTLEQAGISSARLDCLLLLEDEIGLGRASLLAHPERALTAGQTAALRKKIMQRKTHLPLAYIRGEVLFYGRPFAVNKHVLVPRPETETMIDMAKALTIPAGAHLADIGTGSGCIGITVALEIPGALVQLYDVSAEALSVAEANAKQLKAAVQIAHSDMLEDVPQNFDVLLANLPYVPADYPINTAARHEPELALFAGKEGLDAYRLFWQQLAAWDKKPSYVLTESLESQHSELINLAQAAGFTQTANQDLIQLFEYR